MWDSDPKRGDRVCGSMEDNAEQDACGTAVQPTQHQGHADHTQCKNREVAAVLTHTTGEEKERNVPESPDQANQ